jgi:hypothetical protein
MGFRLLRSGTADAPGEVQPVIDANVLPPGVAWPRWVWGALLVAIVVVLAHGVSKAATESPAISDVYSVPPVKPDRRGTDGQPLVVSKSPEERSRDELDGAAHASNERVMMVATVVLAAFTVLLWAANIWLIRDGRRVSAKQSLDTQMAIAEAKRSGDAMRDVADATKNNAVLMSGMLSKQMRAYIQVNIGTSTAQREEGIVFGSWPEIINVGLTPAKNVSYRVMADVLDPAKMARDYPEPQRVFTNDATLNPRQNFAIQTAVNRRFDAAEVEDISKGESKRLFVWGTITYDDVFDGRNRETRFSHNFVFFDRKDPETGKTEHKVNSFYSNGHNDAT